MARPGTSIIISETPPPRSAPTDTGVWFVAGLTEKGAADSPHALQSMSDYTRLLGSRVSYGFLYDALDAFFREGGNKAYVARVVGPAADVAEFMLVDGGSADTLLVQANSPGEWGNSLNIAVLSGDAGGEFKLQVSHDTDGTLETSPSLVDKDAAMSWAENSDYITLTDQASTNDPAAIAAQSLSGGTDDRNNIADAHWLTALNLFARDMGPGQISAPGRTTANGHGQLLDHAYAKNRIALLDPTDTGTKATLLTEAAAVTNNVRYGGMFAPWVKVPGVVAGTTRTIPPSALVAGLIARSDVRNSQNVPAAGDNGQSVYSVDLSQAAWDDDDREELNAAGVSVIRAMLGGIRVYGWRTLADSVSDPNWVNLANSRLLMALVAQADVVAESFLFDEIDGAGIKMGEFNGALKGMLLPYWNSGSLFGATPDEAFFVDTGPAVNTPETLADNQLRAVISLRMSPMGELVTIEIVKKSIAEAVV